MRQRSNKRTGSACSRSRRHRDRHLAREEVLRPCRYLGYDRDQLGLYFLERGADELAESQFRRAAWLNPYEVAFRVHWAAALARLQRKTEARELLLAILLTSPDCHAARDLWPRICPGEALPEVAADSAALSTPASQEGGAR